MATQTTKITAAPAGKQRGFKVCCPRCSETSLSLAVENMDMIVCTNSDCATEFDLAGLAEEATNLLAFCQWVQNSAPMYSTD